MTSQIILNKGFHCLSVAVLIVHTVTPGTHGNDIFLDSQTALASSDEVAIGHRHPRTADNALSSITFPYNVFGFLGNIASLRTFAFHFPHAPNKLSISAWDLTSIPNW
jgi:hypothetical protein